jgi:hypothetical protein
MAGPPAGHAQTAREAAIARAELRFESYLTAEGEAVCVASLPLVVEQVAADQAGGDATLCAEITARLRRRAGLHTV